MPKNPTTTAYPCDIRRKKGLPYRGTPVKIPSTQRYNNRSRTQKVHHATTFNNQPTGFPMEGTKEKTIHQQEDYDTHVDPETDTITVDPTSQHTH